ncbi:hypothetical protein LTR04_002449, partial [Oleoguttula sp. CCFEE 6159]
DHAAESAEPEDAGPVDHPRYAGPAPQGRGALLLTRPLHCASDAEAVRLNEPYHERPGEDGGGDRTLWSAGRVSQCRTRPCRDVAVELLLFAQRRTQHSHHHLLTLRHDVPPPAIHQPSSAGPHSTAQATAQRTSCAFHEQRRPGRAEGEHGVLYRAVREAWQGEGRVLEMPWWPEWRRRGRTESAELLHRQEEQGV